jgi:hypothetical protein
MASNGMARGIAFAVVVGTSALALTCCSSSSSNQPPATSVVKPGATVPFNPADNVRSDVTVGSCTDSSAGWVVHGTVVNPGPGSRKYQIVVDFVTHPGSTVVATTVVNVPTVAAGSSGTWSAVGAKGKTGVDCVVRLAQST